MEAAMKCCLWVGFQDELDDLTGVRIFCREVEGKLRRGTAGNGDRGCLRMGHKNCSYCRRRDRGVQQERVKNRASSRGGVTVAAVTAALDPADADAKLPGLVDQLDRRREKLHQPLHYPPAGLASASAQLQLQGQWSISKGNGPTLTTDHVPCLVHRTPRPGHGTAHVQEMQHSFLTAALCAKGRVQGEIIVPALLQWCRVCRRESLHEAYGGTLGEENVVEGERVCAPRIMGTKCVSWSRGFRWK